MLRNQKGIALIIEFLILLVPLTIFYFGLLTSWQLQLSVQYGEHLHNYYMNRTRLEGWLSEQDMLDLVNRYHDAGLEVTAISAPVENIGLVGVDMSGATVGRVLRDTNVQSAADINQSIVWLFIEAKPIHVELPEGNETVRFRGRSLSEKVGP